MLTSGLYRGSELIDTFAVTANRSSRRRSYPIHWYRLGMQIAFNALARGVGQIEIRDQGDLFVRTRLEPGWDSDMRLPSVRTCQGFFGRDHDHEHLKNLTHTATAYHRIPWID